MNIAEIEMKLAELIKEPFDPNEFALSTARNLQCPQGDPDQAAERHP